MMSRLTDFAGTWQMVMSSTLDEGKTWQKAAPVKVAIKYKQRGLMLEEAPEVPDPNGFNMHTLITYDQYKKVYRKVAIDDVWGIMDIYEGHFDGQNLVFTNLKAETFFPIGPDKWRGFRLTLEPAQQQRRLIVDKTDDKGKSWQPAFVVEYTRL